MTGAIVGMTPASKAVSAAAGFVTGAAVEIGHVFALADQPLAAKQAFLRLMRDEALQAGGIATSAVAATGAPGSRTAITAAGAGYQAGVRAAHPIAERLLPHVNRTTPIHGDKAATFIRDLMARNPEVVRIVEFGLGGAVTGGVAGAVGANRGVLPRTLGALKGMAVGAGSAAATRAAKGVLMP